MRIRPGRHVLPMIILTVLFCSVLPSAGQDYGFAVPEMKMQVYVQPDSTVRIAYQITFKNGQGKHPIDVVDMGVPHGDYSIANMSASIDGRALTDIRPSEFVKPGLEIHLENQAISPGGTGVFRFEFTMPNLIYQDTTRKDYASLQITPTWFGREYVLGQGKNGLAIHMLEGIKPDEVLHQGQAFTQKALYQGHTVVLWQWTGPLTGPHKVGVSFPQRGLSKVVEMTKFGLLVKYFEENTQVRVGYGFLFMLLLALLFFRFSGGTGCAVFVVLGGVSIFLFSASTAALILSVPAILPVIALNEWALHKRKGRGTYLPPIAEVAGGGIKRGLTAPEAAVLLELSLVKVLSLVIFGLLKKGIIIKTQDQPLKVEIEDSFTAKTLGVQKKKQVRLAAAQKKGVVLHGYENLFLDQLESHPHRAVKDIDFKQAMERLIQHTANRLKGFDVKESREYYQKIVSKAVKEARSVDLPERDRYIDQHFQWIMMDEKPDQVFYSPGYTYWPIWFRTGGGPGLGSPSIPADIPSVGGTTSLGDVAGSYAGWAENTMSDLATAISPDALNLPAAGGGFIDLGGVDKVTSDVFEALKSSSGGGGGGGGCACAGCACACACAGGGR